MVQVEPGPGADWLRVECPGRFVVLPDFFADDLIIDARTGTPPDSIELPSENFVLHLAARETPGPACVENRKQD